MMSRREIYASPPVTLRCVCEHPVITDDARCLYCGRPEAREPVERDVPAVVFLASRGLGPPRSWGRAA